MNRTFVAEITEFLRPNGRKNVRRIVLPESVHEAYETMRKCGCRLTLEELRTNQHSITIEEPNLGDFAIVIVPIGSNIEADLVKLLGNFTQSKFEEWKIWKSG